MDRSEQHRHRCEVRQVLAWRVEHGIEWVKAWLDGTVVDGKRQRGAVDYRGKEATDRLRNDAREQWQRGNRGAHGDWR